MVVDCETFREAISARIDGEPEPVPADRTDQHLQDCEACRTWQARATEITRTARIREATSTPDLTASILEVAPALLPTRGWWPRLALGVVALAQLTLGLAQILGVETTSQHAGHAGAPLTGHLFNESTAWNLAIGIGLAWAAFRPRAAAGILPVLAAFVLVLLGYSTHDLITGAAPASRIVGHTLLIAALILLVVVHRQHRTPTPGHHDALPEPDTAAATEGPEAPDSDHPEPDQRHPLRPVGRHNVA